MDDALKTSLAAAAAAGFGAQQLLTRIHEVNTPGFLLSVFLGELALTSYLVHFAAVASPAVHFFLLNTVFFTTLTAVTAFSRLYLSPLAAFPGPRLAALSKLYEAYLNYHGRLALTVRELHRTHGDVVRMGPSELSICNVDAVQLLGRQKWDSRGPLYMFYTTLEVLNLLCVRERGVHRMWRGIWDQAFSSKALEAYAQRVELHVDRFIGVLAGAGARTIDVVPTVANMAFDIMADLGFGRDYGMQAGTGDASYMGFMHSYMRTMAILGSLRNLAQLVPFVPSDAATRTFRAKGEKMLTERLTLGNERRDVFSHLLAADVESGMRLSRRELASNAQLVIVAGSDTTSSVLANALRELALQPRVQEKLFDEIKSAVPPGSPLDVAATKSLPLLAAVVDETLRLWNPVPSGAQMMTGEHPVLLKLDGGARTVTIPPRTAVRIPHLALMTDERYFPDGERWWPERWLAGPDGVADQRAFIPFSYGPHVCVGKQLALAEMRLAVARTVRGFRLEMDDAQEQGEWWRAWSDFFTVKLGSAGMKFIKREE